ncbi:hypothetical protein R3I93_010576 [Phoxinus phoxinus]|uniref:Uncharacterized protein n=1 Tax=Phoxinus phoxinus TaxID=58324 RepID=A0AAN9D106_9TELE
MIGVVVFFLGVLLTTIDYNYPAILVYSGITYWGSCIYFSLRIVGMMLVFTIPQFIISICISAFACKATCNRDSTVVSVALN